MCRSAVKNVGQRVPPSAPHVPFNLSFFPVQVTRKCDLSSSASVLRGAGSTHWERCLKESLFNLQVCSRLVSQAEARLAAKRAARAEARDIRMRELERQQKEVGKPAVTRSSSAMSFFFSNNQVE